ncbi:uncharacterized protein LOC126737365 isoform X2 [Anthonomus grandis grandis]|uniref:uncharacterized protein LOC126737365 isoform X2 n=1 Tax=Anthonomus grandis grandis TaxID=2921223 RepID=UPI00216631F7|nr:uncharacterized protein LOC126737365 isoform X2 [Anthonomus grandis grandis]
MSRERQLVIIVTKITSYEMEDSTLLEFGSIGEYAALRYHTQRFSETIPDQLTESLMMMMVSDNAFHHLFANRIMQNIWDRHHNKLEFETPRIFFRGVSYNIKIARYSARDRKYYKRYRLAINRVMMKGLRQHYYRRLNLENIYTNLAIICVEIPCSYVASSIVSFAMAMQEYFLLTNPPDMVSCHHVHAMVMSLMTLVCYVHRAEIFYNYVAEIMERRSDMAPQLNPPLKAVYTYAQNHILWNKPDLFFEDWEARYGLWKCFRTVDESFYNMVLNVTSTHRRKSEQKAKRPIKVKNE